MPENDPDLVREITEQARMAAGEPIKHPPGLSPEIPQLKRGPRSYNIHQINEALKLAKSVGVAAAAKACGVSIWAIYKAGARPRQAVRKKCLPDRPVPRMDLMVAAAKLALYWNSNIPGFKERQRMKRECFDRAAIKYKINPMILWEQYTTNGIEGVPYP